MSHYALLVITPMKPTKQKLERLLAPFEEDAEGGKWDWFAIGGRWTGLLMPGYEPENDPENIETCKTCGGTGKRTDMKVANGCNGCDGTGRALKWPTSWADKGNQMQVADLRLTLEDHRRIAAQRASAKWDEFHAVLAGRKVPDFDALREQHGVDKARDIYWSDPVMQDLSRERLTGFAGFDHLLVPREQFIEQAQNSALTTFAVFKGGKWYERGEMGWFGISHKTKEDEVWHSEFSGLLARLDPSEWLTVVDCHI